MRRINRIFRTRKLEVLIVCVFLFKLAFSAFPLISKNIELLGSTSPLSVKGALAKDTKSVDTKRKTSEPVKVAMLKRTRVKGNEFASTENAALTDLDLEKVKEDLVKREAFVEEREKKLKKLKTEVEKKIENLLALQKQVEATLQQQVDRREKNSKYLAKMCSSMKPKNAATLLSELDENLAVGVLKLMKPDTAGKVLSYLDAKKAARLAKRFYYR